MFRECYLCRLDSLSIPVACGHFFSTLTSTQVSTLSGRLQVHFPLYSHQKHSVDWPALFLSPEWQETWWSGLSPLPLLILRPSVSAVHTNCLYSLTHTRGRMGIPCSAFQARDTPLFCSQIPTPIGGYVANLGGEGQERAPFQKPSIASSVLLTFLTIFAFSPLFRILT